jgi:hypothetical protein
VRVDVVSDAYALYAAPLRYLDKRGPVSRIRLVKNFRSNIAFAYSAVQQVSAFLRVVKVPFFSSPLAPLAVAI